MDKIPGIMGPKLKTTSLLAEKMKPLTAINSEGHRISNKICPGISNTQELNLYFLNFKIFSKYKWIFPIHAASKLCVDSCTLTYVQAYMIKTDERII